MIQEIVTLQVKAGMAGLFLNDFRIAQKYIGGIDGFFELVYKQVC